MEIRHFESCFLLKCFAAMVGRVGDIVFFLVFLPYRYLAKLRFAKRREAGLSSIALFADIACA